jgi:hypothetical protein
MSPDQILDELDHLATVEHALCVEYLFLHGALGDVVEPGPAGGQVGLLAVSEMRRLHGVNRALVAAGRPATLGRATEVRRAPEPPLPLAPLTAAQLDGFPDRELAVAAAVDARYAVVRRAVADVDPPFDAAVRELTDQATDAGVQHAADFTPVRDALAGLAPADYLRATRDQPAGEVETGLVELGDHYYALIVEAVHLALAHEDEIGDLVGSTVQTMFRLEDVHRMLASRGLLPRFTPPVPPVPPVPPATPATAT